MKISKYASHGDDGVLRLSSNIINKKIESRKHTIMVRECLSDQQSTKGLYAVHVALKGDPNQQYLYSQGRMKPKSVLGTFLRFGIKIPQTNPLAL